MTQENFYHIILTQCKTSVKAPPETRYLVAKFGTKKVSLSYLQGGNKRC